MTEERVYPDFAHRDADTLASRVLEALEKHKAEIDEIKAVPQEEATFRNTVLALEESGKELDLASAVFFNLLHADADDRLMERSEEVTSRLTEVANEVNMDRDLALKVKAIYEGDQSALSDIEKRLLFRSYDGYKRSGAFLTDDVRGKLKNLRMQLAVATLNFGQNMLKEQNAYRLSVRDASVLTRLPESALRSAKKKAEEEGLDGYVFDFSMPSYTAIMKYCDSRPTREKMARDRARLCFDPGKETSNISLVYEIAGLRSEISRTLGYETFAECTLSEKMAKKPETVLQMLDSLRDAYLPKAREEVREVQAFADTIGGPNPLEPWDWSYYTELFREKNLSYDEEATRPYFSLGESVSALFGLAHDLYGISIRKNDTLPAYHPDVTVWDVTRDEDGSLVGTLLTDFFPRKGKQSGAWMTNFVEAYDGVRPVVSLVMNFTPETGGKPSLLTFDEVSTMFHEFGHGLHGLLTRVPFSSLSGTNVVHDFVELPSQIMENWLREPDFLRTFARHYETGETIPEDIVEAITRNARFLAGYACVRQLGFGYLDMAWYGRHPEELPKEIEKLEDEVSEPIRLLPKMEGGATSTSFGHIFSGGYAAGYYGYKWSEILDADAFEEFRHAGLRDKSTADRFRTCILEKGDSEDPEVLYERFKGRAATPDALLRRDGLTG